MIDQAWRKSSFSGSQANCVEVGCAAPVVLVRDTKDRDGQVLSFGPDAWRAFAVELKQR